ncbi:MAG: methyltransferase domain-containing protein [Actinomycetota bacterium]|nr:methyltransferase domain-containing protein [Actinomycetota bacterium]
MTQPEGAQPEGTQPEGESGHWFEAVADHLGAAYLRYSFTMGTEQEADAIIDLLGLRSGERILDVGCGPGRHSLALARRGLSVVGVDISRTFVELARRSAQNEALDAVFVVADARTLDPTDPLLVGFDAVISLCQGAFGLAGGPGARSELPARELDEPILAAMAGCGPGAGCWFRRSRPTSSFATSRKATASTPTPA